MVNIDRIITESINKQVLYSDLQIHKNKLYRELCYLQRIRQNPQNNQEIGTFLNELNSFTFELINALNRCIENQDLNEAASTQMPLSNVWNAFLRGYRKRTFMDDWLDRQKYKARYNNKYYNNVSNKNGVPPKNATLTIILTQYYPPIQRKYVNINKKYDNVLDNMKPPTPKNIISEVKSLIVTIKNAQGLIP